MMRFITKMVWEYGEEYEDVYYPQDIIDFRRKLYDLDELASKNYPFYLEIYCSDDTYIGIIVGHELSCLIFAINISETRLERSNMRLDTHYDPSLCSSNFYLEYSYKADHGEKHRAYLLPKSSVFQAINQFIETGLFPSFIAFERTEIQEHFVDNS